MDFLDPKKLRAHQIRLLVGYGLLAIAVVLATVVLLYQARGFGVKQGKVIQNGSILVSSNPGPAAIILNNKPVDETNVRLVLEAGSYTMKLTRDGYHDWQRALTVEGGSVEHFTYPFLIPRNLATVAMTTYESAPVLSAQSPDRRWVLEQLPGQIGVFDQFDTREPKRVQAKKVQVSIPADIFSSSGQPEAASVLDDAPALVPSPRSLEVVEWSNDNIHVLLRHVAGDLSEYILFNRDKPIESVNLSRTLGLTSNLSLAFLDKKFDRYFIHDTIAKTLSTVSLADPQPVALLNGVLAYKSYGDDTVLYTSPITPETGTANETPAATEQITDPAMRTATGNSATSGTNRVNVKLYQDKKQHTIRQTSASDMYLLGLSRYKNAWYVMAGVSAESRVYVYKNPAEALRRDTVPGAMPVPVAVLKTVNPNFVAISANSQLMMAQNGNNFSVYDAEYDRSHTYQVDAGLDPPQTHAIWMDGHHLQFTSGGKIVIFDYDGTNVRTLAAHTPAHRAYFDTRYRTLYTLAPPTSSTTPIANPNAYILSATPLRTVADQ